MRIKDNLNDCKQPAGLNSAEQLSKCGSTVGDFSEDGDQDSAIKAICRELAVAETGSDKLDVH